MRACDPSKRIIIRRIGGNQNFEFKNVSAHLGITKSSMLKKELADIINSYPEYMKEKPPFCEPCANTPLTGVGRKTKEAIRNISEWLGVNESDLLKIELSKRMVDKYPEHIRKPPIR